MPYESSATSVDGGCSAIESRQSYPRKRTDRFEESVEKARRVGAASAPFNCSEASRGLQQTMLPSVRVLPHLARKRCLRPILEGLLSPGVDDQNALRRFRSASVCSLTHFSS